MKKVLTKAEFRDGFSCSGEGKDIQPPKIDLFPVDKCRINGSVYSISINEDDMIVLEKVSK